MTDQIVRSVVQVVRENNEALEQRMEERLDSVARDARRAAERAVAAALREDANGPLIKKWREGKAYKAGDMVEYRGGTWQCRFDTDENPMMDSEDNGWSLRQNGIYKEDKRFDGERTVVLATEYTDGSKKEYSIKLPLPIHRGVWEAEKAYERGDEVAKDGSLWRSKVDGNKSEPGTSPDWTLSSLRGKTGKQGERGEPGEDADPVEAALLVLRALTGEEEALRAEGLEVVQQIKNLFTIVEPAADRMAMYSRGEYEQGQTYRPGDVVTISGLGMFICVEETISDPRTNSRAWRTIAVFAVGGGVYNGGGGVTPPTPPFNFLGAYSGDNDGNIRDREVITLGFNDPVDLSTLRNPRASDGSPIPGTWSVAGLVATFTPSADWQDYPGPYSLSLVGVTSAAGTAVSNATVVSLPLEVVFDYVSTATGESDGNVYDQEPVTLTFTTPVNPATLSYPIAANGFIIPGAWTTSGNTASFVPSPDWQSYTGPFTINTASAIGATGVPIGNPAPITVALEPPPNTFAFTGFVTEDNDGNVRDREAVELTFSEVVAINAFGPWKDSSGVTIGGTWNSTRGGGYSFTPTNPWHTFTGPFLLDLSNIRNSANQPLVNSQVVSVPLEPFVPLPALTLNSVAVQSGATAIANTKERIAVNFNRRVNPVSFGNVVVTRTDTGAVIPGFWAFMGTEAWFTPTNNWPMLTSGSAVYRFTFNGITADDNGDPLTGVDANGNLVRDLSFVVFNYISHVTSENDNKLFNRETLTIRFDNAPDLATLPAVKDNTLATIPGSWAVSGANAVFTPSSDWQNFASPAFVPTSGILGVNGAVNTNATAVSVPIGADFVKISHSPTSGNLTASQVLRVTFNLPVDAARMPSVLQNGLGMPGSWSASGNTATFTPSQPWSTNGATVVLNWTNAMATNGQLVVNSGSQNFRTWIRFFFTGSQPLNGNFVSANGPVSLTFDQTVDASSLFSPTVSGQPVAGTWSGSGGTATFTPSSPMPVGATLAINYATAMSTGGFPIANPGGLTLYVARPITYTGAFPNPGSTFTGASQLLLMFDAPPLQSSLPQVFVFTGFVPMPQAGIWEVFGNNARFTPSGNWIKGIAALNTASVKNLAGEAIVNPTNIQWTVT